MPALRGCALLSVRPPGSFLRCISENCGRSPRSTGIPTTRASTEAVQSPCKSVTRSVPFFVIRSVRPFSHRPPSARAPRPGCNRPALPHKGYLQSRQRSSWFPLTRLLDGLKHRQWHSRSHIQTRSNRIKLPHELVTPLVSTSLSVSFSRSG